MNHIFASFWLSKYDYTENPERSVIHPAAKLVALVTELPSAGCRTLATHVWAERNTGLCNGSSLTLGTFNAAAFHRMPLSHMWHTSTSSTQLLSSHSIVRPSTQVLCTGTFQSFQMTGEPAAPLQLAQYSL